MNYIYVKGNLVSLGRENALGISSQNAELGVGKVTQMMVGVVTHSFIEVLDASNKFLVKLGLGVLTKNEANAIIATEFEPAYSIKNEGLMNANINQLVTKDILDLESFDGVWDEQHELQELYEKYNVSGITKSTKPIL